MKLVLRRAVVINADPEEVFRYIADFSRAKEWRVGVRVSVQSPPGTMHRGARLYEEMRVMGTKLVTEGMVDAYDPPRQWSFQHVAGRIPVAGEYRCESVAGGTRFVYTLRPELTGMWRLVAPMLKRSTLASMEKSLENTRQILERGAPTGAEPADSAMGTSSHRVHSVRQRGGA